VLRRVTAVAWLTTYWESAMRILNIIPQAFYVPRGTPLSAYHRARELIAQGHQVDILCYGLGDPPPDLPTRVFRARGPHFARSVRAGPSMIKIWLDFLLLLSLFGLLLRRRYDVLFAHEEAALHARFAGALFRIPYVYEMHSSLPLQITDWKFSRRRTVIGLFRWIERTCVRGACASVAISPAVAQAARKAWPDARCVVLTNYFPLGQRPRAADIAAVRARHGVSPEEKLIVYTGSFVALQALDLLLEAAAQVLRALPSAKFLLVGGAQAEIDALRSMAMRLGIADNLILERSRPQSEIPAYLAAADALVSPRVQGINPPGKLLSYLAAGRPLVATDTLVHNQLLSADCAILTTPDAEGLARGLILALTDAALAVRLAEETGKALVRLCGESPRRDAYDEILAAARLAGSGRVRRRTGLITPSSLP
jgi:glycosyltransferase involved in cell wall biosynthesis